MDMINKFGICTILLLSMVFGRGLKAQQNQFQRIDQEYQLERISAERRIDAFLKKRSTARISYKADGSMLLLVDVSPSGVPIYIQADNADVATSLGVDELRSGGTFGLNLEGDGIQIGIWDDGKVRTDHVELTGRVTQIDNTSSVSTHATHVLGTIMATGLNANARGMAPKTNAIAYDFFSDVSEMTSEAGAGQSSIILSNHSYGTRSGWDNDGGTWTWHGDPSISNLADWKFGFYNTTSKLWDDIAFNAPYYLIVKSAGNDNNDVGIGPQEPDCNPFDCIPTSGVAKNIMTVGATKKLSGPYTGPADVEIASFSSRGPADDGRIKPDIVAPGQAVFSSSSTTTNAYTTLSGTSMSAPAATGSFALLQELHKNLNAGNLMKAATLKALAIHTAREAGANDGPDYIHGWGLLDTEAAAGILIDKDDQNIFVEELSLAAGQTYELDLSPVQDTKITATIVWTDPAGTPPTPSLNPTTSMLVNDLDLRIVDDGGTSQFPWILNPSSPASAAIKGDNFRDNVEKIEFDNPEPRNYKLRVSHKGILAGGQQDFSLIVNYTSLIDPRVSYYWIGNSGNWDDGTKWSLSSGGIPANVVPGVDDKVVFDENSFSLNNQTVSLTQDQSCYSIRWFANEDINLSFSGHALTVRDGITLLSNNISSTSSGLISIEGDASTNTVINLANNDLGHLDLTFAGSDATWSMIGNVSLNQLELVEGSLTVMDSDLGLNSLLTKGPDAKTLIFTNSQITAINSLQIDIGSSSLESEGFMINIPSSSSPNSLDFGSLFFDGTISIEGAEVDIIGTSEINKIEGSGIVNLFGNHLIQNIALEAGSSLRFEAGSTQTFTDSFSLSSTVINDIEISSLGPAIANIQFDDHYKICLDHLAVSDVAVTGESVVSAGLNSTLLNADGWLAKDCDDILFADFASENECVDASVFFLDNSSGPITGRAWDFGNPASPHNSSTLENPIHFFSEKDDYLVTLTVSNGAEENTFTRTIQLIDNTLEENTAELNNGKLISFLPSGQYQWVLDGTLIEGATSRSFNFLGALGEYAVLTFDDVCNRKSSPFIITGLEESPTTVGPAFVYPNPTSGLIHVGSPDNSLVKQVQVLEGLGRSLRVYEGGLDTPLQLDLKGYRPGIYLLRIQTEQKMYIEKIIVR